MASVEKWAGPAKSSDFEAFSSSPRIKPYRKEAILHAARLYGSGYSRGAVARMIFREYFPHREDDPTYLAKLMRNQLRSYEKTQWFRDMVWDLAVVDLDMSTPQILRGVASKAKRGRVDAAKLALAIVGRYQDKANETPSAVTINLVGIPRPVQAVGSDGNEVLEAGEIVDED